MPGPAAPRLLGVQLIALTGGIAAGKSTVGRRLAELGASRIDADQLAREVVEPGTPGLRAIRERFGAEVIRADGALDRAVLGARVFGDAAALADLNAIVHPAVRELAERRIAEAAAADPEAIVVYEIPLLVETGGRAASTVPWDLVVVADAPAALRIDRLVELRGLERAEAERRIGSQAGDAERRAIADVVIDTSGTEQETLDQVDALWARLRGSGEEAARPRRGEEPISG